MNPSPDLPALRLFLAVAERRSFRATARALGISPSRVSQGVRALEVQVGEPLLRRTTRSVALTAAGERLATSLRPALTALDGAWAGALTPLARAEGTLRLNLPRHAAEWVVTPLLAGFLRAHPGVTVELLTTDGLVDIVKAGCDAGVRFPDAVPQDMVALPIGPARQRFVVVAAPALAVGGAPQTPDELLQRPCTRLRFPSGDLYRWELRQGRSRRRLAVQGPLTVDDQRLALRAALDGVGWAYVYEALAAPYLREGRLVQALAD